jgi:hypothetical protein
LAKVQPRSLGPVILFVFFKQLFERERHPSSLKLTSKAITPHIAWRLAIIPILSIL